MKLHKYVFARLLGLAVALAVSSGVLLSIAHRFHMSCMGHVLCMWEAALTYITKCKALKGEWLKFNHMTERFEYLHMTQSVVEKMTKRWQLIVEGVDATTVPKKVQGKRGKNGKQGNQGMDAQGVQGVQEVAQGPRARREAGLKAQRSTWRRKARPTSTPPWGRP